MFATELFGSVGIWVFIVEIYMVCPSTSVCVDGVLRVYPCSVSSELGV